MRRWASLLMVAALLATAGSSVAAAEPLVPLEQSMYEAQHPHGVVVVLHGGGWMLVDSEAIRSTLPDAQRFQAWGWDALNLGYRRGRDGLDDTLAAIDWARRSHPGLPVCLYGESAGGHFALVAASRVELDCVMTQGAVVDPMAESLGTIRNWALLYFGLDAETVLNPVWLAEQHRLDDVDILLEHGTNDFTDFGHAQRLCAAAARCRLDAIRPGPTAFTHGYGSNADLFAAAADEHALLSRINGTAAPAPSPPPARPAVSAPVATSPLAQSSVRFQRCARRTASGSPPPIGRPAAWPPGCSPR